jgi:hypothetical protein
MAQSKQINDSTEIVVFSIIRPSECAECKRELWKGEFLRMEQDKPLCLSCADLDHLFFLPRGDMALTRRASKYSRMRVVVVRFSRARKRYERQGVLVEEDALTRAEKECLDDAEATAELAIRAHVRHEHTAYDELLGRGVERFEARALVDERLEEVLASWKGATAT